MGLKLEVPLVKQDKNMSCWHAAACMVAYYHVQGPRLGVPQRWEENKGLPYQEWPKLAKNEGFKVAPWPGAGTWSSATTEAALAQYGPLWSAGRFYFPSHVIVLTGIDGETVYLNDPWEPAKKTNTLAWFNSNIWGAAYSSMLYHPRVT